ncbi:type II and III secretion system protein family protein [Ancylobacter sp. FA202]|uniref:type II and III secretion system protein family protein n=1 Tax=Ancylobacter sp. FA202 TaxID=1111106 RepID=UPI000373D01C|nr:type II and III secretion system protein family protein [Ancylobacter sp. FA202]
MAPSRARCATSLVTITSLLLGSLGTAAAQQAQPARANPGFVAPDFNTAFNQTGAAPAASAPARGIIRKTLDVGLGRSYVFNVPRAAADAYVADPKVATATVQTDRQIYITGIGPGTTTILISSDDGSQIAEVEVRVARDVGSLSSILAAALPGASISVRMSADSVVLSGAVPSAAVATKAMDIAQGFVGSAERVVNAMTISASEQVMLKVTVAEVQRNVLKQLGVNAAGTWEIGDVAIGGVMSNPFGVAGQALSSTSGVISGSDGTLSVEAMEQVGVARTLAEPVLTAISGETANFLVGGEVPIPTGVTCTNDNSCQPSIEFKKFGVSLTFAPTVLSSGNISLRVATEVSEVDTQNQLTYPVSNNSTVTIPAFKLRKQETTVELPSGGSLVTAGLIQQGGRQAITGVPGLMHLPVLGALFRSRDYQRQETELVIIVQPMLARPLHTKQATRPDQGFADAPDPRAVFFGQVNRIIAPASGPRNTPTKAGPPVANGYYGHAGFIVD